MGLNIQKSTMGYDTVGLQKLINDIKIDIIPAMATSIRNSKNSVRDSIGTVWVGASSEAFKDKLDKDTEVLCNTLINMTHEIENDVKTAGVNVEELDMEIAKMFGGTGAVAATSGLSSAASSGGSVLERFKTATSEKLSGVKSFLYKAYPIEAATNILKKTGATVATATFGLVEGLEMFGEAIVDTVAIVGTGVATLGTGAYDLITGSDATKQMWDKTKGFVSTNYTKNTFDKFYENTGAGQWIQSNAVGFNVVRNVSSGIGYTAGIVAATVLTAGVAGVAVGAGAAGTSAVTVSAGQLALTAGVAGFGRGTQDAWADGAGTLQGLGYGVASGAWEAAQFYAGAKIGGFEAFSSTGANVAARIGMDTVDGALEGFVQPAMQMIYKDGTYKEMFEANGGWGNVAQQAAIGAVGSAIGEAGNLRSMLKTDSAASNIKVTPETTLTAAGGVLLGGDLSKNLEVNTKSIDLNTKSVDLNTKSLDTNIKNVEVSTKPLDTNLKSAEVTAKPLDKNLKSTDINTSTPKVDTNIKTDTSAAVKADTPSVAKTDTSIKADTPSTAKVETAVKADSNVSNMKADTTVKADTSTAVKADSNVSNMKADTTVKADTSTAVKADSNVSNMKADTTVKADTSTAVKADTPSVAKTDTSIKADTPNVAKTDTSIKADATTTAKVETAVKAESNVSSMKADTTVKTSVDATNIKTDANTSTLKPDIELVGGSYKPSFDEATVKLSDTANLKPDVELVGGTKVDLDGPTVKLGADVNESTINIFDSSKNGLKPDVELFDSNGVKSGLDTNIKADTNVSSIKADTTTSSLKPDVELFDSNGVKSSLDTTSKVTADVSSIKADATSTLKPDVELVGGSYKPSFDEATVKLSDTGNLKPDVELVGESKVDLDGPTVKLDADVNESTINIFDSSKNGLKPDVELFDSNGVKSGLDTKVTADVSNIKADATSTLKPDVELVGGGYKPSFDEATVKLSDTANLKPDVELVGGTKVDLDGPTVKLGADVNESTINIFDSSKNGLKPDVELFDSNGVKSGLDTNIKADTNVSSIKADATSTLKPDVELVGGSYKPSFDEATVKLSDTGNLKPDVELVGGSKVDLDGPTVKLDADVNEKTINIFDSSSSSGLKPDVELFDSNGVKSSLDTTSKVTADVSSIKADTTTSSLKPDVELIDSSKLKVDTSGMSSESSLNTSLAGAGLGGGSFASSSPAISLGGVGTTGVTGAVGVATTLANSTPTQAVVGNAISDANVKVNSFDSANVGSPVANSINSTTSTNVSGLKADVELIDGNTPKPSFDASVKPVVDTTQSGLKADVDLIDTNPVKNGVTASVSSVTNGAQSKFSIPLLDSVTSKIKTKIDSAFESKVLAGNDYIKPSNGNIICTNIPTKTALDDLNESIAANFTPGYAKYGATNIPEQLVYHNYTIEKIIQDNPGMTKADVIRNIATDYGNDSIQALTARGNVLVDSLYTPEAGKKIANIEYGLQKGSAEYYSSIASHINELYEKIGLKNKEYTTELYNSGVDIRIPDECSEALDKIFASDKQFWDSLSKEQLKGMKTWTSTKCPDLAAAMRKGDLSSLSLDDRKALSQLFVQLDPNSSSSLKGLSERTLVYRGLDDLNWIEGGVLRNLSSSEIVDTINNLGVGSIVVKDNAFASSTPVLGRGFTGSSHKIVEVTSCPAGTSGSWIGTHSSFSTEVEYLLSAGAGNKKVILGAEEIGGQVFVYTQMVE